MANRKGIYTADEAREILLEKVRVGWTLQRIADFVGKSLASMEYYLKDPDFKKDYQRARDVSQRKTEGTVEIPDFPEFSEKYLGMKLYPHQLQWFDLLEGRAPRNLHPMQVYVPGDDNMLLINTPPFHAKTTCITTNYVTWRIVQNPNIKIAIISKTQSRAKEMLHSISERLSSKNRLFQQLKDDFAPQDGFDGSGAVWTASKIYLSPEIRDQAERDPTVQALGWTQQLYGARIDLMILDDVVDLLNSHLYADMIKSIQTIASSRMDLATDGQIVIVGTRLAAQDLYSEIRKPTYYAEGESPWTYLTQPAVLEFDEHVENWRTLWPKTNRPLMASSARKNSKGATRDADGLYDAWPGWKLAKMRGRIGAEEWARVYQQQQVSDSTTFTSADIDGCSNGLRFPGHMVPGQRGHREEGMAGLHVVAGMDPATAGYTAAVCLGVDIQTGRRYVLDVYNKKEALPHERNELIKNWTMMYGVREWRIETVGFQRVITQDQDLLAWTRGRGVQLSPHITNKNKWDETAGVATMAMLFKGWERGLPLIELPNRKGHFGMQSLCDQLVGWYPTPSKSVKAPIQDCVMALWFAELRARELTLVEWSGADSFFDDGLLSDMDREMQFSIDMNEWNYINTFSNWKTGGFGERELR